MTVRWLGGALLAATASGPMLTLPLFLVSAYRFGRADVAGGLGFVMFTIPFGFVVAILPALAGSALLAWLGARRRWARHSAAWAVAGAALGTLVGLMLTSDDRAALGAATLADWPFALLGATCALLARWRTRWEAERG